MVVNSPEEGRQRDRLFPKGAASTRWHLCPPSPTWAAQLSWEQMEPSEMEVPVSAIRPAVAGPGLPGFKNPLTTCGHVSLAGSRGHKSQVKNLQSGDRVGMATGSAGEGSTPGP